MRNASLSILAAVAAVGLAHSPAEARSLRGQSQIQDTYCLQGRSYGYPGNCQFSTYEQCLATASGTDSACGINPRRAYYSQQQQQPRGYGYGYGGGYYGRY